MSLIVVYNGIGKIAADQLKKLLCLKNDSADSPSGNEDYSIDVIAWDENTYEQNAKARPFTDKVLFVGSVKGVKELFPIAKPVFNKFGVVYSFAGPQATLTVDHKKLRRAADYNAFLEELNNLTYQHLSPAPRGFKAIIDTIWNGTLGAKKRREDIQRQQFIYGVTKLYYQDLRDFLDT